jgi:hypothetical protein
MSVLECLHREVNSHGGCFFGSFMAQYQEIPVKFPHVSDVIDGAVINVWFETMKGWKLYCDNARYIKCSNGKWHVDTAKVIEVKFIIQEFHQEGVNPRGTSTNIKPESSKTVEMLGVLLDNLEEWCGEEDDPDHGSLQESGEKLIDHLRGSKVRLIDLLMADIKK